MLLQSIRPVTGDSGGLPRFEISLLVLNPNRTPLNVNGVAYSISLAGHEVVEGVGKGFAPVEPYSEGEIQLVAGVNVFGGIRLMSELMRGSPDEMAYEFEARLDVGFGPRLKVTDAGSFSFAPRSTP